MNLKQILDSATPGPWTLRTGTYDDPGKDWHGEEYVRGITIGDDDFIETDGGAYGPNPANARLIALAPELAALVLDMGEELRYQARFDDEDCGEPDCEDCKGPRARAALLARLDQLGKEPA